MKNGQFSPCIVYENDVPAEYAALKLTSYPESNRKDYAEISSLLEDYYAEKTKSPASVSVLLTCAESYPPPSSAMSKNTTSS